jgi:hypothetical protein
MGQIFSCDRSLVYGLRLENEAQQTRRLLQSDQLTVV